MRIIEKRVYNLDELEKSVQEKVIAETKQFIKDDYCEYYLEDDLNLMAEDLLKEYFGDKAKLNKVHYDLSFCQGSGCMIDFDLETENEIIKIRHDKSCRYMHERSFEIIYDDEKTENIIEKLENKIVEMNKKLKDYGEDMVLYEPTDDEAIEMIKANNYEYYSNGQLYAG